MKRLETLFVADGYAHYFDCVDGFHRCMRVSELTKLYALNTCSFCVNCTSVKVFKICTQV